MGRVGAWTIDWGMSLCYVGNTSAPQSMDSLGESSVDGKH
jgi:hypothetical protein